MVSVFPAPPPRDDFPAGRDGMPRAHPPRMNAIYFGLKRAFQSTLRITRPRLELFGLTAARFDLLNCLRGSGWMQQRHFRRLLGVTAQTISRMLRSLERLGLIVRQRSSGDRRQLIVELTEKGRTRLWRANESILINGPVRLAFDIALGRERWFDDLTCLIETENLQSMLIRIRHTFGDVADLQYPWHPDD